MYILSSFTNGVRFTKTIQMIKLRKKNARTMQQTCELSYSRRFICKSPLRNPMRRWKNNYKVDLTERKLDVVDLIYLVGIKTNIGLL